MNRTFLILALAAVLAAPLMAADAPATNDPGCCLKAAGAQHTVTNLENGVKVTITSTDPKVVAQIKDETASCPKQGCAKDCPMQAKGVTRTVEKTDTGVVITATAADAATVKALQEHAATMWDNACPHQAGMKCTKGKAMTGKCPYAKGGAAQQS
jgi:TusA-related sulfurtransferase